LSDPRIEALNAASREILARVVRQILQHGLSYEYFADLAKQVFIKVAEREFPIASRKVSTSRISAITGIPRKEVSRIRKLPPGEEPESAVSRNRAANVLTAWLRDEDFLDRKGDPLALPLEGNPSFSMLVKRYSGDVPPRAIADELERLDAIERDGNLYRLTTRSYVPASGTPEIISIFGTDTAELMDTIAHNIERGPSEPSLYQTKVSYDNVPVEYLEPFRKLSRRMSQSLLEELDRWLAEHDRDYNPDLLGSGKARTGLMIFQFEHIEYTDRSANDEHQ
jgi:hypothetical protein